MMLKKIYNLIQTIAVLFVLFVVNGNAVAGQDMPFQILGNYDVATKRGGLAIPEAALTPTEPVRLTEKEYQTAASIHKAQEFIQSQQYVDALSLLDAIIDQQQLQYKREKRQIYAARTLGEAMAYVSQAMKENKDIVVITNNWSLAYYLKSFALVELGRIDDAKDSLAKALQLSPQNALYLAEQAHYYQRGKNWVESNRMYSLAEDANKLAPDNLRDAAIASIWRSMGFNLIEMGELDKAEQVFQKALVLNPHDQRAKNEMEYIQDLKDKGQSKPPVSKPAYNIIVIEDAANK